MRSYAAELPADLPDATPPGRHGAGYVAAQLIARIAGAVLATAMFDFAPPQTATTRASTGLWLGEIVATAADRGHLRAERPSLGSAFGT